jgi:hypothetical protein
MKRRSPFELNIESLSSIIAKFANKESCMELTLEDLGNFTLIFKYCSPIYKRLAGLNLLQPTLLAQAQELKLTHFCVDQNLIDTYKYLVDKWHYFVEEEGRGNMDSRGGINSGGGNSGGGNSGGGSGAVVKKQSKRDVNESAAVSLDYGGDDESFYMNSLHQIIEEQDLEKIEPPIVRYTAIYMSVSKRDSKFLVPFYMSYLKPNFLDKPLISIMNKNYDQNYYISGLNFEIKFELFNIYIWSSFIYLIIAVLSILLVTIVYLKSFLLTLTILVCILLAMLESFFIYKIVMRIEFFSFMNIMSTFVLIGIACDDVFVFYDTWCEAKSKYKYMLMSQNTEYVSSCTFSMSKKLKSVEMPAKIIDETTTVLSPTGASPLQLPLPTAVNSVTTTNATGTAVSAATTTASTVATSTAPTTTAATAAATSDQLNAKKINAITYEENINYDIVVNQVNSNMNNQNGNDKSIYYNNPMLLGYLEKCVKYTFKNACKSIFVTSFTTAAGFLVNLNSSITAIRLFGVYASLTILVDFVLMILLIPCLLVMYSKYSDFVFEKLMTLIAYTNCFTLYFKLTDNCWLYMKLKSYHNLIRYFYQKFFDKWLPDFIVTYRYVFLVGFFLLGSAGFVLVFYKPSLSLPNSAAFQFFSNSNPLEYYSRHFSQLSESNGIFPYQQDNKPLLRVNYVFGLLSRDMGNHLRPDDIGPLEFDYENFNFYDERSQLWFAQFCKTLKEQNNEETAANGNEQAPISKIPLGGDSGNVE